MTPYRQPCCRGGGPWLFLISSTWHEVTAISPEQLQSLVSAQEKETLRANEAEQSLLKTSEGLAAQVAHQNGEHLSLLEKHKELGADVDRRFADLQAAAEADWEMQLTLMCREGHYGHATC
eukprot:symbB.v1.2.036469.t1/scaffold5152.1/size30364/2